MLGAGCWRGAALRSRDCQRLQLAQAPQRVGGGELAAALDGLLEAAISVAGADFGNVQLLDPGSSRLEIVAHRGFSKPWLNSWKRVAEGHGACGTALETRERVIVDGWAFLAERSRDPGLLAIPVIVISAQPDVEEGVRAAHARLVQKPILVDRLLAMMKAVSPDRSPSP